MLQSYQVTKETPILKLIDANGIHSCYGKEVHRRRKRGDRGGGGGGGPGPPII